MTHEEAAQMKHRIRCAVSITWLAGACQGALFMAVLYAPVDIAVVIAVSAMNVASTWLASDAAEEVEAR